MDAPRCAGRVPHMAALEVDLSAYDELLAAGGKKPGAFARYRYREDLFPTLTFRKTYDAIAGDSPSTAKDLAYLRILHLAAATTQTEVEAGLVSPFCSLAPTSVVRGFIPKCLTIDSYSPLNLRVRSPMVCVAAVELSVWCHSG